MKTRLIGAHVPVTGGVEKAPARAVEMGATAMQVFTRNQMMWKAREMTGPRPAPSARRTAPAAWERCSRTPRTW
jgi:endonuclease IV